MAFVLRVRIHTTIVVIGFVLLLLLVISVRVVVRWSIIVILLFILVKQTTLVSLECLISSFSEQDHIFKCLRAVHEHLLSNMWLKAM